MVDHTTPMDSQRSFSEPELMMPTASIDIQPSKELEMLVYQSQFSQIYIGIKI